MAMWRLLILHLFRLGSGAGGSLVPLHYEPNTNDTSENETLFVKSGTENVSTFVEDNVQNPFLAKNNFDYDFDSHGKNDNNTNHNLHRHILSRDDHQVHRGEYLRHLALYVHYVYMVLYSLVFRMHTGHHDFYQVPMQKLHRSLRGRQLQVASAPAGAHGEPSTQYLNTTFDNFFVMDMKVMLGILIGLSMVLLVGLLYKWL